MHMATPIINNLLNQIAHAKKFNQPLTELRMTNRQFDNLRAEAMSWTLYSIELSNSKFAGLPIVIDDTCGS